MKLPILSRLARSRSTVAVFGGYDHTPACAEGQWQEEENLSARRYPALAPRLGRTKIATLNKPHGLYAKNGLIWVDGTTLFYNGTAAGCVSDTDKQFCGIGAKVLIFPDQVYLDTTDGTLHPLGAKWASVGNVTFSPAQEDGSSYTVKTTGTAAPETPENGEYWLDTGGENAVLRVYSAAQQAWSAVATAYVKLAAAGIGKAFARYDTVTVSGVSAQVCGDTAADLNADLTVWSCGEDYLVVAGVLGKTAIQSHADGEICIERRIPSMDFVTESNNRVWGCSNKNHEIYACKLGDPTNWYSFMGTAADSFAATVGSDGDFTGAAAHLGYVFFFKENMMHKIYGTKPANFQITAAACSGVRPGAANSISVQGEELYYLAADGVMRYDGSLPVCISRCFGAVRFTAGAAGAANGEVRFAAQDAAGKWQMYCYEAAHGTWHLENTGAVQGFACAGETLYWLCADGGLWAAGCTDDPYAEAPGHENSVAWRAETGDIGLTAPGCKYVSRLEVQLETAAGTSASLFAQYDGNGTWALLKTITSAGKRTVLVPVPPRRYRYLRLRLAGKGEMTLYAVSKIMEAGSEL